MPLGNAEENFKHIMKVTPKRISSILWRYILRWTILNLSSAFGENLANIIFPKFSCQHRLKFLLIYIDLILTRTNKNNYIICFSHVKELRPRKAKGQNLNPGIFEFCINDLSMATCVSSSIFVNFCLTLHSISMEFFSQSLAA